MENKNAPTFFFAVIAIVVGSALYKKFDFVNLRFEKPVLAVVYIAVFTICIYFLMKNFKNKNNNQ